MRRTSAILPTTLLILLGLAVFNLQGGNEPTAKQPTLPGARATIEAIDYPSLQAALDALPEEGGLVRLPAGSFTIQEPLRLTKGDVSLVGAGASTHIQNANTEGKSALVIEPADFAEKSRSRIWRVEVANLRITGNPESGHGLEANGVNEIYLHGLTLSENGGDGAHLNHCIENPRIASCMITYNKKSGVQLIDCHDIVVNGNHFEENLDALRCEDGYNLCMTGNNLDDHLRDGVVIANTYGSVLSGNMIEECQGRGIVLERDCYGIAISANAIPHNVGGGIDLIDAHGCSITGNALPIMKKNAIRIGPDSSRIVVAGNAFSDSTIGPDQQKRLPGDQQAAGLVLEGTSDVAVAGNLFSGVEPKALTIEGEPSRRILFSGNVLTDVDSDHANLPDSVIDGNLESEPR